MSSSLPLVEQGDTKEGYLPRGPCEMLIAGAAYAISEGAYAFPQGSTEREWSDWVQHMSVVAVRYDWPNLTIYIILIPLQKGAFKQVKRIAKVDKRVGVSFVPFVLWNFLQLHSNYEEHSVIFDLSTVLAYDHVDLPKGVKTDKLRACHGDQHFLVDVAWMAECSKLAPVASQEY